MNRIITRMMKMKYSDTDYSRVSIDHYRFVSFCIVGVASQDQTREVSGHRCLNLISSRASNTPKQTINLNQWCTRTHARRLFNHLSLELL